MPAGTNVSTSPALVPVTDVQFLYDLTRVPPQGGELIYEQRIFDEVFRIVDEARSFIVADFFLLNEHMGAAGAAHRPLSRELVERLIARKQAVPSLSVLLITDPINDVYGGAPSPALAELRERRHRSGGDRPRAACGTRIRRTRRCGACCCSGGATPPPAAA